MAEPTSGVTLTPGNLAAIGLAIAAVARAVWSAVTSNYKERIAVLESECARKDKVIEKLGADKDNLQDQRLRMAGLIVYRRALGHSDFDELPSGVKDIADLMDPRSTRKALKDPLAHLEGWDPNESTPPGKK